MELQTTLGGLAGIQTPAPAAHSGLAAAPFRSQSPAAEGKALLTFAEVGKQVFGVSERKAHDIVKALGIVPVVLGPRCVRVIRSEVEAAVANLPRRAVPTEPSQLLRGKIERAKSTGSWHATT